MEKGGLKFPSPPFITLTTLRCVILITQHIGVSAVMCHLLLFRPIPPVSGSVGYSLLRMEYLPGNCHREIPYASLLLLEAANLQ